MGCSRRVVAVSLGVLALVGCTTDGQRPTPTPSASSASAPPSSTPAPSTPPATATPGSPASVPAGFTLDDAASPTFPDLGDDLGGVGIVRVGRHSGYDRVVWEFEGDGRPTYRVRYVDEPTADGSGDVVAVRGDAFLEVLVTTVSIPDAGSSRPPDASASTLAGTVVAEANAIYGGFEGYGQSFIGVHDRERPFRVTVLTDPTRLVVDIASG
ncbi:hypothetical protein GCM10023168_07420 [Fodinibacter luteus]|uniref:AMIN-like domain-containing protein n=1 Tax=Fodinibacter luteus TaxID=552064 RepID=A0ABP8K2Y8_9MICO